MKTLFVLIFLLVFSSYSKAQNSTDSAYYPMTLGNEWDFVSNIDPHPEIIVDTLWSNGNLYFGFSRSLSEPEFWLRQHFNRVYYLNIIDRTEFLLFDFTMEIGDSIELPLEYDCSFGTKIFLVSKSDTIITPSGTFYNCYHFQHQVSCFDGGIVDSWFARGIGKVKYVANYWAGISEFILNDYSIITSVNEKLDNKTVHSFKLFQNYPNPFNPSTNILFSLPNQSRVTIIVYDLLGDKVKTLIDSILRQGFHSTTFDAKNLPSGIYIVQIMAKDIQTRKGFNQTQKIALIK